MRDDHNVYSDVRETQDLRYLRELTDEFTDYISAIILNVFNGVAESLGHPEPDKLSAKPPKQITKGFLSGMKDVYSRLRGRLLKYFNPKTKFKPKGINFKKKKPPTDSEWKAFNKQIDSYTDPFLKKIADEISVKGILLGMASAKNEIDKNPFDKTKNKSYEDIEKDHFSGIIPDTMSKARAGYNISKSTEDAINIGRNRIATYLSGVPNKLKESIRNQIIIGYQQGKDHREIASDLYWMAKDKMIEKKSTAQYLMRDWHRVAATETAYLHSIGKMAQYEDQAKESITDNKKAVYYVFTGGTCDWCSPHHGKIVRMVPRGSVKDESDDSLSGMGIHDKFTDTAVWIGKNNIGYKKQGWRVCTPAHPYNTAHLARIDPITQKYNKKTQQIKYREKREISKLLPKEFKDKILASEKKEDKIRRQRKKDLSRGISKKHEEYYVPPPIEILSYDPEGKRTFMMNDSLYAEVEKKDADRMRDARSKDNSLPIPIVIGTPDHKRILGQK